MEAAAKKLEKIDTKKAEVKLVSVSKADETSRIDDQEELERQLRLYAESELCYNNCGYYL